MFHRSVQAIRHTGRALAVLLLAAFALPALAAIPQSERNVLIALYSQTNGDSWLINPGWKVGGAFRAPGTECTWSYITCDAGQTHVESINITALRVTGTLPDTLRQLTRLKSFYATANNLSGLIPDLSGMTALKWFSVDFNQLTGTIPSLSGLTALQVFYVSSNQLTGSIPSLSGLPALSSFGATFNQLTGPIPSLSGLTALQEFRVTRNQLTGPIPSLSGLTALVEFDVDHNQLTGPIPSLNGLTALRSFFVNDNQLTGPIPSLNGLTALKQFRVANNQLTGAPPAPPASLVAGVDASLCPNYLTAPSANDADWNTATRQTPWNADCTAAPSNPGGTGVAAVPSLSEWGLMLLGLLAAGLGARRLRRPD